MKLTNYFIKITLSLLLIFTYMITPALSFQQAMTEVSENVYTLGDVGATLSVSELSNSTKHQIYPYEYIPAKPYIMNTGTLSEWIILSLKVPSINAPYLAYNNVSNTNELQNNNQTLYYPAFHTTLTEKSAVKFINTISQDSNQSDLLKQTCSPKWEMLEINTDFANTENGFFIYYFGLRASLKPQEIADAPFLGFYAADFQNIGYDYINNKFIKYDLNEFKNNLGIEMRLFAVQAQDNQEAVNVNQAWTQYKTKYSVMGENTVVSSATPTELNKGRNIIEIVTTQDVTNIRIENTTTGVQESFDLATNSNILSISNKDESKLKVIKVNANFIATGDYVVTVKNSNTDNFTNPVALGYITVNTGEGN